jgi:hypothetical protein
MNVFWLFEGRL